MGLWLEPTGKTERNRCIKMRNFAAGLSFYWFLFQQLGLGSDEDQLVPSQLAGVQVKDRNVLAVSSGGQHTLFIAADKASK